MRLIALLLLACAFASCENKDGKVSFKVGTSEDIRNDISLKSNGLTVKQAFLQFEDGKLVPGDNKVEVGQKVNMILLIEGWEPVDGKVFLGASEKIATNDGDVFLDQPDLFEAYPNGVNASDAGSISLSAKITRLDKLYKYFEVSFRVWDKKSKDDITGAYKLYLK